MTSKIQQIYNDILEGNSKEILDHIQAALLEGIEPKSILENGMIAAMREVGKLFEQGDYFVPEMLIAARAMQTGLGLLKPYLLKSDIKSAGKIVLGTVKGDLHDIGKNLVGMMLEGAGYEVIDLGVDISPEKFVEAVQTNHPDLLAMSALLTTTMPNMKTTIQAIDSAGIRSDVKIMIGGAPVTEAYANQIGADGYAPDASRAVGIAETLIKSKLL